MGLGDGDVWVVLLLVMASSLRFNRRNVLHVLVLLVYRRSWVHHLIICVMPSRESERLAWLK